MPLLSRIKNKGPFIIPSKDVQNICKISEKVIRQHSNDLLQPKIKSILISNIHNHINKIGAIFDNKDINEHVLLQRVLDNHRSQLCKWIIEVYLNTRLFYESKKMSVKDTYIRAKYTKLILFNNQ